MNATPSNPLRSPGRRLSETVLTWAGAALVVLLGLVGLARAAEHLAELPGVREFVQETSQRHGFDPASLDALFARGEVLPGVLEAVARPAEAKPWHEYRRLFVTPDRIDGGAQFWDAHRASLERATTLYGVPPEVVVAILGVETRYGRSTGAYRVFEALATLAFSPGRRADFFRRELEQLLLLAREEGLDPFSLKGSYAGAMGLPQFISSSFRRYAVDFDGDGRRDIWADPDDAIGSVAAYLKAHGWEAGARVAVPATVHSAGAAPLVQAGLKPTLSEARLAAEGVSLAEPLPPGTLTTLVQLETQEGYEYWAGLQNFYAITRYNHSPLYAMAVYQLSQEIRAARGVPRV